MTASETVPEIEPDGWDIEFQRIKKRFPRASDATLFCIAQLDANPSVKLSDLKAIAAMHELRIGAHSVRAAKVLLGLVPASRRTRVAPLDDDGVHDQADATLAKDDTETQTPTWETAKLALEQEFPAERESILFCLHKLRQDPELTIPDFREEAKSLGIKLGGRSLHSALVLLGLAEQVQRGVRSPNLDKPKHSRAAKNNAGDALGNQLIQSIRQIEEESSSEARALRLAIRKAVEILRSALDEP